MIQVNNLHKEYSGQVLFEDLAFNLERGERIGLVGRNGSGKSTLFSIILGKTAADQGDVSIPKGYEIGSLDQHIHFTKATVIEECCQVLTGDNQFDFYKAEKILFGLGFTEEDLNKTPGSFSGGYQIRINLCKSLLTEPNILLLDEPTNYLDIVSLRWLRQFLNSFPGEVILITHDQNFMNSVTTHTMGLYRKKLKKVKGDTYKFYEQMLIEDEMYEKTRLNQEKKRAHLESFIDRFGAKASKATQAQSKVKQLEKMGKVEKLDANAQMGLNFQYKECPGKVLLTAENLAFSYEPKVKDLLFNSVNFTVGRNERIAIIGKNGKGKSTLLNVIGNELVPTQGKMTNHPSLTYGHLGQTNVSRLSNQNTIIQEIQSANSNLSTTAVRNICGSLMFDGDLALKKISVLSGGEKNRVLLGKIMAHQTNLLLLDEPTNHLDMEAIEVLTEELTHYPGAIILVTHSEEMLRRVATKLIIFHRGGAEFFDGGYDDFLEKIGWEEEGTVKKKVVTQKFSKKELHAKRQVIIKERSKVCGPFKKSLEKAEKNINELEKEVQKLNSELEIASNNSDGQLILDISAKVGKLHIKIQAEFEAMEEAESKLSIHNTKFDKELEALTN